MTETLHVSIVGCGLAGLSCALTLARHGVTCTLVSLQPSERSQSVLAEGGINAALNLMGEQDSWHEHRDDTLRSAAGLANTSAVSALCEAAPHIVEDLIALGVPFQVEGGHMVQRHFGGQKKARTAYVQSSTGKVLVSALISALRRYEAKGLVRRLDHHELVGLHVRDGVCHGLTARDLTNASLMELPAPVVLCAGGYAGLFGARTTGSVTNDGSVLALALASGVELANLEFVQYHPTTVPISDKRLLVSEAARGEGGRLFTLRNGEPWYFMEALYPDLANLAPRDVVSLEEARVLADASCEGVWLDLRKLPRRVWHERLADMRDECRRYLRIDPACEPIPVAPGIHYTMGGILVDAAHRTNITALLCAGELACAYHGANRLGGNSLLGALFGGQVAGLSAMEDATVTTSHPAPPASFSPGYDELSPNDEAFARSLSDVLSASMGVVRDGATLASAYDELSALSTSCTSERQRTRVLLARAAVLSACARKESRGAHRRADFPEPKDSFRAATVVRLTDEQDIVVDFRCVEEGDIQ